MAHIKDLAVGDGYVYLTEGNAKVKFYLLAHDYESSLNGTGRALFCRESPAGKGPWSSVGSNGTQVNISWGTKDSWSGSPSTVYTCSIYDWLTSTYFNKFPDDVKSWMSKTKYSGRTSSIFTISAAESVYGSSYKDGSLLSEAARKRLESIFNAFDTKIWTRTQSNNVSYTHTSAAAGREDDFYYDGIALSGVSSKYYGRFSTTYGHTYSWGYLPCFTLPEDLYVTSDGSACVNTAPTTPGFISVPSDIRGGTTITISWGASTDAESNLSGYKLECSTDGGSTWAQIYQGAAVKATHAVTFGTATVTYRVKAYDSGGLESGWKTSSKVTVINNTAPIAPASITVPAEVKGGSSCTIKWGAATDAEGNLSGYILERSVGGAAYAQVYKGTALTYTDSITKGWASVAYRVKAYDSYNAQSGYTTSATRTVINNTAPTITAASTALGTKSAAFAWAYTVSDVDGDKLTVTEKLDGTTTKTRTNVASGTALTFEQTNTAASFQCILNGAHTLQVIVSDGKLTTSQNATFTKAVYAATISLAKPITVDSAITVAALSVTGSIPADAVYKVEATNNALDTSPVWQDVTAEVKAGINFIFSSTTATKGAAFNFRVTVSRGSSGKGGYIEAISGAFQ